MLGSDSIPRSGTVVRACFDFKGLHGILNNDMGDGRIVAVRSVGSLTHLIRVAMGQLRPVLGDVQANAARHLDFIAQAKEQGSDLIVFPELGLTGYQIQDLTLEVARNIRHPEIEKIVSASRDIDVVFSFAEESDEHLFYTTAIYAAKGAIRGLHRKVYLPTYGMFDESRYFASGRQFKTFASQFGQTGMLICEDAWHLSSPYLLAAGGAKLLILPASSPARSVTDGNYFGSQSFWRELASVYSRLLGVNIVFVNRVGFEDGVSFFGGSFAVGADGEFTAEAPKLEEGVFYGELDLGAPRRARYVTPILRDEKWDVVERQLGRIIDEKEEWNGA